MRGIHKVLIVLIVAVLGITGVVGYHQFNQDAVGVQAAKGHQMTMTVTVDGRTTVHKVPIKTGETLLDFIKRGESDLDIKVSAAGFIESIDGAVQDTAANKFWVYTVNGEQTSKSAAELGLHPKDKLAFELKAF